MDSLIDRYIALLKEYNEHTNVYSKSAYNHLLFHVADSVQMAKMISNTNLTVLDMGSGSGLPSVCISIVNTNNRVFAVESRKRKCDFLNYIKTELSLDNFEVYQGDVASFASSFNQSVDWVTAKAFKPVPEALKWARRFKIKSDQSTLLLPISNNQKKDYPQFSQYVSDCELDSFDFSYFKIPL